MKEAAPLQASPSENFPRCRPCFSRCVCRFGVRSGAAAGKFPFGRGGRRTAGREVGTVTSLCCSMRYAHMSRTAVKRLNLRSFEHRTTGDKRRAIGKQKKPDSRISRYARFFAVQSHLSNLTNAFCRIPMYSENPKNTPAPKGLFPVQAPIQPIFIPSCKNGSLRRGKFSEEGSSESASYKRCPPSEVFLFLNKRYRKAKVSDIFRLEHVRFLDIQKRPVKASRGINNVPGKPKKHACPEKAFPGTGSATADF